MKKRFMALAMAGVMAMSLKAAEALTRPQLPQPLLPQPPDSNRSTGRGRYPQKLLRPKLRQQKQ